MSRKWSLGLAALSLYSCVSVCAQPPGGPGPQGRGPEGGPREGGPRERGPREGGPGLGGRGIFPGEHRPNPIVAALDTDGDLVISVEEIAAAAKSLLKLDKNADGKLTEDEFRPVGAGNMGPAGPRGEGPRGEGLRGEGRRGPGSEGPQGRGPGFDGPSGGFAPGDGPRGPRGPEQGPPPHDPNRFVDHAMEFDADNDGKLSREELMKFASELPPPPAPPGMGGPEGRNDGRRGPRGEGGPGQGRPESDRPVRPARPAGDE